MIAPPLLSLTIMPERSGYERATVLCVDDEAEILFMRRVVLEQSGYRVITTASGAEALDVVAAEPVDLVLLDFLMPEMRGDELALKLKENKPKVPIIAVSAVEQLPTEFLETVDGYVQKGEEPEVLLGIIRNFISDGGPRG